MWIGRGKISDLSDDKCQRNYEYCDSRANERQMAEKYAAEMLKWHQFVSKPVAAMSMET
jgi:hypothetical protein